MEERINIQTADSLPDAIARILSTDITYPAEITIQKLNRKRSNSQNSLYWKWLTEISQQMEVPNEDGVFTKLSREDWHDLCRMKFLGVKVINLRGKEFPRPAKSTKQLKVGEFAEYLTEIESHFLQEGVRLTFPQEYGLAMGKS